jgi:hypothetical protein
LVNFCHKVAGRTKKRIKIKNHELYEKSGMEGISVHGNCGGEGLKKNSA